MDNQDKSKLEESSLSRLFRSSEQHDCGMISAWISELPHTHKSAEKPDEETKGSANDALRRRLRSLGYEVTPIVGDFIDPDSKGSKPKREDSFFVVDVKNTGNLERHLQALGQLYKQWSVMIVPRGSMSGGAQAYWLGTKDDPDADPQFGQKSPFDAVEFGKRHPKYNTWVNGHPFYFVRIGEAVLPPNCNSGFITMLVAAEAAEKRLFGREFGKLD